MISRAIAFPECSRTCPRVAELEEKIAELEEELAIRKEEVKRLRRKLRIHENPHTPPSRRLGSSRPKKKYPERRKPGRRRGHEGVTRPRPVPRGTIIVDREECPNCGSELGDPEGVETRVIEDIPKPQPLEVTEYKIGHYFCETCKEEVIAGHPDLPPEGRFGYNVVVQTTISKFEQRLPHEKIADLLKWRYGLKLSTATTYDLTRRAADWLRPNYEEIKRKVRKADVLYVDETGIHVDGKKGWIWTFATGEETLFALRMSRGKKVLKDVLGENFDGSIVCDGWRSYAAFTSKLQRCWATC